MQFTNGNLKITRGEAKELLIARDGDYCRYPGCQNPFVFTNSNPRTLDHYIARANGGSDDLSNLVLMHSRCNTLKGDRKWILNENGAMILEPLRIKERVPKVPKRPPTDCCNEGHDLGEGEICDTCGSLPQPLAFPKWAQVDSKECDHSVFHCKWCVIGLYPRTPASIEALVEYDGAELRDPEFEE